MRYRQIGTLIALPMQTNCKSMYLVLLKMPLNVVFFFVFYQNSLKALVWTLILVIVFNLAITTHNPKFLCRVARVSLWNKTKQKPSNHAFEFMPASGKFTLQIHKNF